MLHSVLHIGRLAIPKNELVFRTSRSGGPGGQNVNKLETRVELLFDIANSPSLSEKDRSVLLERLHSKIHNGILRIVVQKSRSQWKNKQLAIEHFSQILLKSLSPQKVRIATEASKAAKERRLKQKKMQATLKKLRRVIDDES